MTGGHSRTRTVVPVDTPAVLELLQEVAATTITPRFRALASGEVHEKQPGDLVTVADREAEVEITARLRQAYPMAVVLGEEAYAADHTVIEAFRTAEHAFTVDPVDGTRNFVEGSPDHAVMVAELRGAETVRAWVWQPQTEVAWVAERGGGTWRNGERVEREPVPADRAPHGVTSMRALLGEPLEELPAPGPSWRCCGVDYPRLLQGVCDYILYARGHAWDHAPGVLLTTEAGGAVAHADGTAYDPRLARPGIVAAADAHTLSLVRRRLPERFPR